MMKEIVSQMNSTARLTRREIWHPLTPYIPNVRVEFSKLARTGFVGKQWREGGVALVGSNGNSKEGGDFEKYKVSDEFHAHLLRAFRDTGTESSFAELMIYERSDILGWWLYSTIHRVLQKIGASLDKVAILNVIPFSTQDSPNASSPVWDNSINLHFEPLLRVLKPHKIIWLGKAAEQRAQFKLKFRPSDGFATVSRQRNLTWTERLNNI